MRYNQFDIGDYVIKTTDHYRVACYVIARFQKRDFTVRYVVETLDGLLLFASDRQLEHGDEKKKAAAKAAAETETNNSNRVDSVAVRGTAQS